MSDCKTSVAIRHERATLTSNFIFSTQWSKSSILCLRRQMIAFSNLSMQAEMSPFTETRNLRKSVD